MKPISPKAQKLIAIIPVINVSVLFIWIINKYRMHVSMTLFFKSIGIIIFRALILYIPYIMLTNLLGNESYIVRTVFYILLYIIPLFIADGLIRFQEKKVFNS